MRKNSGFWAFCAIFSKNCGKTVFFHVFRDTLNKGRKKCEKQRFLSFLRDVPQKVWEISVFSRFLRHFLQSSAKNAKKMAFFEILVRRSQKSMTKRCFFTFSKNSVFWAFCVMFPKKCEKKCVKQCFLTFLHDVPQKCEETVFFHVIWDTYICSKFRKKGEKQRFLSFLRDVPQKVWENSVFHVFRDTYYKVRRNCGKTAFFLSF